MRKRWVKIVIAVCFPFLLVVVLLPFLINADTFRPALQGELSDALGRSVVFGRLKFSLFAGSLRAEDISISDDPAFATTPFLKAKKLSIGVDIWPLVFHRQVRIRRVTIDSPAIQLIQARDGRWNFSSIGATAASPATSQEPVSVPDLMVGELKIKNGSATVFPNPPTAKPFVYSALDVDIKNVSFAASFPFAISGKLPGNGTFKLDGTAGPVARSDADSTPFHATLDLKHLDPVAAGVIEAGRGVSMVDDIDASIVSDGASISTTGRIKATGLQLARTGSPAPQPVDIDFSILDDFNTRTGRISDLAIHTGSVAVHVTGGFHFTPQAIVLDLRMTAPNLPVDQLEQLLPVVGIRVPDGSSLDGGTLTADIAITGPATSSTIAGPVEIDNTKLKGFDLGSRIDGLNPFGGTEKGTEIRTLRTTVNSSEGTTQLTGIYADLPQIGTAAGNGTVSPTGAIDFNLLAKLKTSDVVGAVANGAVNAVRFVGGVFHPRKKSDVPADHGIVITITGRTNRPSFKAHIGAMPK